MRTRSAGMVPLVLVLAAGWARAQNLEVSDLVYQGAFRLPEEFNWGARGATYRPGGDAGRGSLLVLGREVLPSAWGEVTIPAPARADFDSLPVATLLGPLVDYAGDRPRQEIDFLDEAFSGDVACLPARGTQTSEKCYWNINWWYNVAATDYAAVGMSEVDGSNPRGMFHVGPPGDPVFHGSRHGSYMFVLPDWFAGWLGGRALMVGMTREAGCCGGSQGPTLFAARPFDSETPSGPLDAVALVYYHEIYPDCAGPNVGDPASCLYPEYRACDNWLGGAFVESGARAAVVLSGVKGLGPNDYGPGAAGDCDDSQGYHCDPYEAQLIFYSPEELAAAAAGRRSPESVVPYYVWRPQEFQQTDCPRVGGLAYDRSGGRLFVIERGYGGDDYAVVHVYATQPGVDEHPEPDGGGLPDDGGTQTDGGNQTDGGGGTDSGGEPSGCGCAHAGRTPFTLAAMVALLLCLARQRSPG